MPLGTHFQNRYSAKLVRQLTNPDVVNATSVDSTRLDNGVTDAQAWFRQGVGVTYDDNDTRHVFVACLALEVILKERADRYGDALDRLREHVEALMAQLAKTQGRDRLLPRTTSVVSPTSEDVAGVQDRPLFDKDRFAGLKPDTPPAGD